MWEQHANKSSPMLACYQVLVLELFRQHTNIYKMEKRKMYLYPRVARPLEQEVFFFPSILYSQYLSSKTNSRIQKQINFNLNFGILVTTFSVKLDDCVSKANSKINDRWSLSLSTMKKEQ